MHLFSLHHAHVQINHVPVLFKYAQSPLDGKFSGVANRTGGFPASRTANVSHVIYPSGSRQWLSEPSSYCSPLAAVLLPLFHYFPQLRRWRVRSRVYRWYGELALLERDVAARMETLPTEKWLADLERIERAVARINTPAGFASEAYTLREHIVLVRRAIIARNSLLPNTSRLGKISSTQG